MPDSKLQKLILLYGDQRGKETHASLQKLISDAKLKIASGKRPLWDEKDIALITYGDSFQEDNVPTLKTLDNFLNTYIKNAFSIVHVLPFFPYSSDRGFSVIDFYKVDPKLGTWADIQKLTATYRVMADIVINHVSTKSEWFQKFLQGDKKYWDYFIHFSKDEIPQDKLKQVFRPRSTPLLTSFKTKNGERYVWTTFSVENFTDQVDLNYQNPDVFLELANILIDHLQKGVTIFRLDAVAYIWKEIGTSCKHLPQVHTIVSLLRAILSELCPSAILITETNVPHTENISYFGDGVNESQMIYNFSLPGLTLNAFYTQNAAHLTEWAKILIPPSSTCTYFNFLDTHDGIGVLGAKGILSESEIQHIYQVIEERGGKLSYRSLPDGSKTVYEMNSTLWSALSDESESSELKIKKFITARAISMALKGVPALYYLSLFGQENDLQLVEKTKINRNINRTNLQFKELREIVSDKNNRIAQILTAIINLLKKRKQLKAFHPNSYQKVLNLDRRVFSLIRGEGGERVLALHNVSNERLIIRFEGQEFPLGPYEYSWIRL